MTNLPRLELTQDPNKNNDFIIFRHPTKGNKIKKNKSATKKRVHKKNMVHKKRKHRKSRKGFLNIF